MAQYLKFDRKLYGQSGLIPLYQGDDWSLPGTIVLQNGANVDPVDLTGTTGASAFFPASSGGMISAVCSITDAAAGRVNLTMSKTATSGVALSSSGIAPYITLQNAQGLSTIPAIDLSVEVAARGFTPNF